MEVFIQTNQGNRLPLRNVVEGSLVIDIRPSISFTKSHLSGAYSLNYPLILLRRIQKLYTNPNFSIDDYCMDPDSPIKNMRPETSIIIYNDEGQEDLILTMFCDIFSRDSRVRIVSYVIGGFNAIEKSGHYVLQSGDNLDLIPLSPVIRDDPLHDFNYIEHNLAIGAETVAQNQSIISFEGFTHILNVSSSSCIAYKGVTCLCKNIFDSTTQSLFDVMPDCVMFIDSALRQSNAKIFVHCHAGVSRSVSMVAAYYMWSRRISYSDALMMIQERRDKAGPNLSFMGQLMVFDQCLRETNYDLIEACKCSEKKMNLKQL